MNKKVKVCGITNLDDALIAIEAGADALGFVFYEKSPRYISPEKTAEIISQLPPFIEKVGLFVNHTENEINLISQKSKITLAQLHFETEDLDLTKLNINFVRVIRAKTQEDLNLYSDEYRIIDAFVPEYGGMGKRINLEWFENRDNSKIILAGGLTPENIKETLKYNFYGLDVSSGVEESKGKKSKEKIFNFLKIANKKQ
jgi:phosphoribosylanthranilate isomerase